MNKSIDNQGNKLREGDTIRIPTIPESLLSDYLSEEERANILGCKGKNMKIIEIDDYGFVWVEMILLDKEEKYNTQSFSIEPEYVIKIE